MNESPDFDHNDLIERSRLGDDDAFSELVMKYKPMLTSSAVRLGLSPEEHFTDACVGLYRAVLTYDLSQTDVTFGLYASVCVRRRLTDVLRRERTESSRISVLGDVDVDSIAVEDSSLRSLVEREEKESIRSQAREILSDYEYRVLGLWLSGLSGPEIAEELLTDVKSVENAKGRVMKKLRASMKPQ